MRLKFNLLLLLINFSLSYSCVDTVVDAEDETVELGQDGSEPSSEEEEEEESSSEDGDSSNVNTSGESSLIDKEPSFSFEGIKKIQAISDTKVTVWFSLITISKL